MYDSTLWLNYSAVKGASKPKKDVYVKILSGAVPSGFDLTVLARADNGSGGGNVGTPVGEITLTSTDQKLVNNVKSAYTGKGSGDGHRLIYRLLVTDMSLVDADDDATLSILYTIAD